MLDEQLIYLFFQSSLRFTNIYYNKEQTL